MRRSRTDPKSFDLTTRCPECGYKVPPNEVMRLDLERMRCPNCKRDVLVREKDAKTRTAFTERKVWNTPHITTCFQEKLRLRLHQRYSERFVARDDGLGVGSASGASQSNAVTGRCRLQLASWIS